MNSVLFCCFLRSLILLFLCFYYKYMTFLVLCFWNFFPFPNIDDLLVFVLFVLLRTCAHSLALTVITRSYWHSVLLFSRSRHISFLARRKNVSWFYCFWLTTSFVCLFVYTESLRVSLGKSLYFVLFCNVGFCFVSCLYVPEQCSLVVSFSIYLISCFFLLCFSFRFVSLNVHVH